MKYAWAAVFGSLLIPSGVLGQGSRLPGAVEAGLLLRHADGVKRVLLVAAHPDDEDTDLLATLARGWGVEAAYFSFTRGEGGQNLIGTELFEGLGIVRTGELLAARRIDGASQLFGRAFDFGYSKTAEETLAKWPRELVLSDLVWAIRKFRPQVLVTMWSGTPRDGHGHHQTAGLLARDAWEAAGDPTRFPEQLTRGVEAWAPLKFYRRTFFDPDAATLEVPTGRLDPLLGLSHHQLAMDSRSQNRSQGFGTALTPGPRSTALALIDSRVTSDATEALFAGVDTTLTSLGAGLGSDALDAIQRYREALERAGASLNATDPVRSLGALSQALEQLDVLLDNHSLRAGSELEREFQRRRSLVARALLAASSVRIELRARDDVLVPGQTALVEARVWSGDQVNLRLLPPTIDAPEGWVITPLPPDAEVEPDDTGPFGRFFRRDEPVAEPGVETTILAGQQRLWRFHITVPDDAEASAPYFLEQPRDGEVYHWPDEPETRTLPFRPDLLSGTVDAVVSIGYVSARVHISEPVRFRGVTGDAGESWSAILLAPRVSVEPAASTLIWPVDAQEAREVTFRLLSRDPEGVDGSLDLELPEGWRVDPLSRDFALAGDGAETTLSFSVEPPNGALEGEFFLRTTLNTDRRSGPGRDVQIIAYPHIESRLVAPDAAVRVVRFPVQVTERRIGYVMGSGDDGPAAIRQLGLDVELIGPGEWGSDRLDRFDTIVLGVRAYEVREDLIAANPRLLEWVERGGSLIVQYNKYEFNEGLYAPYPIQIGRPAPRVTDETAEVTILDPAALPFVEPNRIQPSDFEGWVQERGLYFPDEWDERYQALLEMADPGEPPRLGSLLAVTYGEGLYIHTSLSFFRQLPAGVPGAYRLFANLLSLDPKRWREITTS